MVCGDKSLGSKSQSLHYCQGYIFLAVGERNQRYYLLMTANKPETVLYTEVPLFLFTLHHMVELVHVAKWLV